MATGLENLWIYKLAEDLEIEVYNITKKFPRDELYRSIDQRRRSSSSAANNIAESYLLKGISSYIKFIELNELNKPKTKKPELITKKPITRSGFTLVEMLISVSLISFVFLAATGIYSFAIGSQRKSAELIALQQEANYLLSLMAKDIRNGMVNYDGYLSGTIPSPTSTLSLTDYNANLTILYTLVGDKIMKNVGGAGNQPLSSSEVQVTRLDFYISPSQDPFVSGATDQRHPRITIVLELKAKNQTFRLQQTVIQRYGERK